MTLFLDMDGVLADFDRRAREVLGIEPAEYERQHGTPEFWSRLHAVPDFYNTFELMPDAPILWEATRWLNPIVLTGVPLGDWAEPQKRAWVARKLGPNVPVITCFARQKADHCRPGDILVDDRPQYADRWRAAGGHFITHTSAATSLFELRKLGLTV